MCLTEPDINASDHYKVLGVQRSATDKEICAAYRRLALRYHPDKNIDNRDQAERTFKRVTCAYETLRDPEKRQQYDVASMEASCRSFSSNTGNIRGNLGSFERSDEIYRAFFGGGSSTAHNIDVAGIFNFDRKSRVSSASSPCRPVIPTYVILAGTSVVVHSLAGKREHNGKSGKVREWNAAKGRYEVSLNCGGVISLRPQNLTQLGHVTVASHDSLNGRRGEVVDFNEDNGRYVLLLDEPPAVVELPPKNCIFSAGTAAVLQGLSDDQLNGLMCTIVGVDYNSSRYVVQCEGGRQLKVRFERLLC